MTKTVKTHKLNSVPELTVATVTAPKLTSSSSLPLERRNRYHMTEPETRDYAVRTSQDSQLGKWDARCRVFGKVCPFSHCLVSVLTSGNISRSMGRCGQFATVTDDFRFPIGHPTSERNAYFLLRSSVNLSDRGWAHYGPVLNPPPTKWIKDLIILLS